MGMMAKIYKDVPMEARTPMTERVNMLEEQADDSARRMAALEDQLASLAKKVTFELGEP